MWKLVLVSMLWGITNAFMHKGTKIKNNNVKLSDNILVRIFQQSIFFLKNWKFTLPFALNQSGSILYMWVLGDKNINISSAVPICTALTSLFTAITAYILGEQRFEFNVIIGLLLIIIGTIFCQI